MNFQLWLEFEAIDPGNRDIKNDFANIHVDLPDGRHYGINVWTYQYLQTSIEQDKETGNNLNGLYQTPPDLLVSELTRDCLEKTINDLLIKGNLEDSLNSSVLSK